MALVAEPTMDLSSPLTVVVIVLLLHLIYFGIQTDSH